MKGSFSHEVVYETTTPVPLSDIIESLRGSQLLAQEIGPLLEALFPGLQVEQVTLTVREISQASPLREAFAGGLLVAYQSKFGTEMPGILQQMLGVHIDKEYGDVISFLFIIEIFYPGQFVYNHASSLVERPKLKSQMAGLIKEVAEVLEVSEDAIKEVLEARYSGGRIKSLLGACSKVLRPSKNQDNAPMRINRVILDHETVAEFPSDAQALSEEPQTVSEPRENVEIHLHAQDKDHGKQGWAAVVPSISPDRVRMHLYPPIKPADLYTKKVVRGDVLLESRRTDGGELAPFRIHLVRLNKDEPTNPPAAPPPSPAPPDTPEKT
jgi:hypothetical protein